MPKDKRKEEIKEYLEEIKKECDNKLKELDALSDEYINDWHAHYLSVLEEVTYPNL